MTNEPPGSRRPGGRTARTRAAVLQAVIGELAENGYAGMTVDRIAARAGVAKTTIYRRWGGLTGLLADVMAGYAAQEIPVPDTGHLDSDLRALAREIVASLQHPAIRAAFGSIVAAAIQDQAARELLSRFIAARTATMAVIVRRASQRGDLPEGTDAAEVLQIVTAQIYYRLLIAGEQPGHGIADRAAATAAAAARANVLPPPLTYVGVSGVDDLHERCVARGARIAMGLADHPWGLRDFVVEVPGGHRLALGERITDMR